MKPIELTPQNPMEISLPGYAANSILTAEDLGVILKMVAIGKGLVNPGQVLAAIDEENNASFKKLTEAGIILIRPYVDKESNQLTMHVIVDLHPRKIEAVDIDFDEYDRLLAEQKEKRKGTHERHITEDPADNAG